MKKISSRSALFLIVLLNLPHLAAAQDQPIANTLAVGLGGYSPVSYFEHDQPHYGSPAHQATHQGVTYFFATQAEQDTFEASPDRFVPAFRGWCAYGMSVQDTFPVDPTAFKIIDGKLYLFLRNPQVDALNLWNNGDQDELLGKAQAHWADVSEQ